MDIDSFDRAILQRLQQEGRISNQDLAAAVNLSPSPCLRRVRRLEEEGVIEGYAAVISQAAVGRPTNIFAEITLSSLGEDNMNAFEAAVQTIPEIVECYTVSGDRDFLLRVVVEDVTAYERLLKSTLVHLPDVANMSSTFALRQVKYTTELPLGSSQIPLS